MQILTRHGSGMLYSMLLLDFFLRKAIFLTVSIVCESLDGSLKCLPLLLLIILTS